MPALPHIQLDRFIIRLGRVEDAGAALDYYERNRAHLAATSPLRAALFYTEEYWRAALPSARAGFEADRQMQCFLFDAERAVGVLNLSNFVRGAFHACHLGYSIDAELQGRGLMTQAVGRVVDFAFTELGMHRVMANYLPDNTRSAKLLERLGFEREGTAKKYLLINGEWRDHVLTARVNDRWTPPSPPASPDAHISPPSPAARG
ncbi:MAG TPA: GNAT family N-acetyltransferase [Polyangiaceae bacterium]|nr:GNAT family N-acetyltransferase [Polyangiaceae bacterium]